MTMTQVSTNCNSSASCKYMVTSLCACSGERVCVHPHVVYEYHPTFNAHEKCVSSPPSYISVIALYEQKNRMASSGSRYLLVMSICLVFLAWYLSSNQVYSGYDKPPVTNAGKFAIAKPSMLSESLHSFLSGRIICRS